MVITTLAKSLKEKKKKKTPSTKENLEAIQPSSTIKETPKEIPQVELTKPETITDEKGNVTGVTLPGGKSFTNIKGEDVNAILSKYGQVPEQVQQQELQGAGTQQAQLEQQLQAQQLGQQVGDFQGQQITPTGLDVGEAFTQGVVSGTPKALAYIGGAVATGSLLGTAVVPGVGTLVGGALGLIAGISGAMISNFKSQRTDTTTAQQRVLDEGKQNLNDWATLAATDPANRAEYVKNFNQQLSLIDQAYRQMKLDTSRDVAKFETALPNLAEFETFYSSQGERDFLTARMFESLQVQQDLDYTFRLTELQERTK